MGSGASLEGNPSHFHQVLILAVFQERWVHRVNESPTPTGGRDRPVPALTATPRQVGATNGLDKIPGS
jgi:hypothetical protein